MKTKILIALCFILLISSVLLFYPYNLYHHFTADEKIASIFSDPIIRERSFGDDDSEITSVKYVGKHHYYVKTEENAFLIKIKSNKSSLSIDIFEHSQGFTKFQGY